MAPADAYLKGLAAVVSLALALLVLLGRKQRGAIPLAFFFGLLAVNQGAEAMRAVVDGVEALRWFRVAAVAASLDPFVLAWAVAGLVPVVERRAPEAWAVGAMSAALALYAGWGGVEPPGVPVRSHVFALVLSSFTAVVYVGLLLRVANAAGRPDAAAGHRALLAGLVLAALPAATRPLQEAFAIVEPMMRPLGLGYLPLIMGSVAVLVVLFARALDDETRATARRAAFFAVVLVLLSRAAQIGTVLVPGSEVGDIRALDLVGRVEVSVRWLAFGALASVSILGRDLLGVGIETRRRAARVLVGLAFLVVGGVTLALVATSLDASPLDAFYLLVLAGALALSQSTRRWVDAVAARLYGSPPARVDVRVSAGRLVAGRYRVGSALRGESGPRSFVATDELLHRRVMLVELPAARRGEEAAALAQARRIGCVAHPNVLALHDALHARDGWVLVAELAEAGTLADALRAGRLRPVAQERIARGLRGALAALHERGVAHGDLRPENVLLGPDLEPKLAGFTAPPSPPPLDLAEAQREDEAALDRLLAALATSPGQRL